MTPEKLDRLKISIHALRGEGDEKASRSLANFDISIHALRGEGDGGRRIIKSRGIDFNPRPPWGGRHVETAAGQRQCADFNPRPPWGGRHSITSRYPKSLLFQSTPSVGRATAPSSSSGTGRAFQSTPSVGRATILVFSITRQAILFQSTPSVGRATLLAC